MRVEIARFVRPPIPDALVRRAVAAAARRARTPGDISIAFVGARRMRELNRQYHGEDRVTDVLAFPPATIGHQDQRTREPRRRRDRSPPVLKSSGSKVPPSELGELLVCPSYVKQNATRAGEPFRRELARVLIHGTLHLLGYDHATPREAERMFGVQEAIVREVSAH